MRQNEVFPNYRNDVKEMKRLYKYLKSNFTDDYVDELCSIRGYTVDLNNESSQRKLIEEMQLGYCELSDFDELKTFPESFGLITKNDNFLLNGQFLIGNIAYR